MTRARRARDRVIFKLSAFRLAAGHYYRSLSWGTEGGDNSRSGSFGQRAFMFVVRATTHARLARRKADGVNASSCFPLVSSFPGVSGNLELPTSSRDQAIVSSGLRLVVGLIPGFPSDCSQLPETVNNDDDDDDISNLC